MATIGIFSGRGDVVLAMAIAFVLGLIIGYKFGGFVHRIKSKFHAAKSKE
jgi:hypothetical protein